MCAFILIGYGSIVLEAVQFELESLKRLPQPPDRECVRETFTMEGEEQTEKGRVCVTGGTGFVASWLIMKLLRRGYSVNTTVRSSDPHEVSVSKKDISFLTDLPQAHDRLCIFYADLANPECFKPAIEGCVGVFHVAHPVDFQETDSIELITDKSVKGTLGILQACLESETVKRVVYTSSVATAALNSRGHDRLPLDEGSWTDVDYLRTFKFFGAAYCISKTVTERAALDFAKEHDLDLITVLPSWIHGPFISPKFPGSVKSSLAMIIGNDGTMIKYESITSFVHTDDVAEAHIHLFEHPEAKGRYICSAEEATVERLFNLVSSRYPEFQLVNPESVSFGPDNGFTRLSSKKLLETGFRYRNGIEEMFDDAIRCCKQKGYL